VALVIKGDVAYYPSEIHESLGIKPFAARLEIRDGKGRRPANGTGR
jgi:hypothetical protein